MSLYLELNKELTPEQVNLKEETHRFAEEVLRPASIELDKIADPEDVIRKDSVLWDVFRKSYQAEHHISSFPEALGGANLGPLDRHVMMEEMGWGSADFAIALGVTSFPFGFAAASGNPEIMKDIVVPFIQDREAKYVGCWAITEPQHGSDSLMFGVEQFQDPSVAFDVRAKLDGDEWVINGQKAAWEIGRAHV